MGALQGAVHLQFGSPVRGSRLAELGRIQFHCTVQDYTDRFNTVLCHARNLDSSQKANLYVGGLPDHIRVDVEMRAPRDLSTAVYLVWSFELRATSMLALRPLESQSSGGRPLVGYSSSPNAPLPLAVSTPVPAPTSMPPPVPASASTQTPVPTPAPAPSFRRLTPAEMLERRRQGLCYNCDEPYVRGHKCQRLFYLEMADYLDDVVPASVATAAAFQHRNDAG
jgi:hypothetical protein